MLDRIFDLNKIQNAISNFSDDVRKEYYNYLMNEFGALFTFHSNRIEGVNNTLTLDDTRNILNNSYDFKSVVDKNKQREINETINHQNAFKYIFDILNQDIDIIIITKSLHQIIGSNIIEGAGSYKQRENYLVNSNGNEIKFTHPSNVESRMLDFKSKYENKWQELTVFERASKMHMAIINIHPFSDEAESLSKPAIYRKNYCNYKISEMLGNLFLIV